MIAGGRTRAFVVVPRRRLRERAESVQRKHRLRHEVDGAAVLRPARAQGGGRPGGCGSGGAFGWTSVFRKKKISATVRKMPFYAHRIFYAHTIFYAHKVFYAQIISRTLFIGVKFDFAQDKIPYTLVCKINCLNFILYVYIFSKQQIKLINNSVKNFLSIHIGTRFLRTWRGYLNSVQTGTRKIDWQEYFGGCLNSLIITSKFSFFINHSITIPLITLRKYTKKTNIKIGG